MVSGLCGELSPGTSASIVCCVVMTLTSTLTSLKSLLRLVDLFCFSFSTLFFFLLTLCPCVADPADFLAKDGPPPNKDAGRRHQEQRASHGLQSPRGPLSTDPGTD